MQLLFHTLLIRNQYEAHKCQANINNMYIRLQGLIFRMLPFFFFFLITFEEISFKIISNITGYFRNDGRISIEKEKKIKFWLSPQTISRWYLDANKNFSAQVKLTFGQGESANWITACSIQRRSICLNLTRFFGIIFYFRDPRWKRVIIYGITSTFDIHEIALYGRLNYRQLSVHPA